MKNSRLNGSVRLSKIDAETKEKLDGAKFALYKKIKQDNLEDNSIINKDDYEIVKEYEVKNGEILIEGLGYGKYYLQETEAPKGYILDELIYRFKIDENSFTSDGKPIVVEFLNVENSKKGVGKVKVIKKDNKGNKLKDVTFILEKQIKGETDGEFKWIPYGKYEYKTNEKGVIEFILPRGKYRLREKDTYPGYILEDKEIIFEVKKWHENIEEDIQEIEVTNIEANTADYIKKTLSYNGADTKMPLKGVTFNIFEKNSKVPLKFEKIGNGKDSLYNYASNQNLENPTDLVTDEDGEIRIGFPKEFIGKTLCYKETKAPDGIKYDKEEKELKILEENKWSNNFITNEFDKESKGGIKIEVEKRDDNKQPLECAEFTLYNKKGDVLSTKTSTKIEEDGSYHAIAIFNDSDFEGGFKVGEEYYIKETKAPEGYILDDSVAKIVVDKESFEQDQNGIGTKRLLFMAINSKYKGLLELKKVDEDGGKPLKGAKFELFRKKNNITKEEQNDENLNKESTPITDPKNWQHYGNYRYKANINGEIVVENLAIGEYYYIEREAPVGYEGTEKASGKFEITKNNNNKDHIDKIEIEVKNKKLENATGKFKLVKKDEEGKNLLEGAEFKLFKLENDIIDGVEYRSYGDNPYTTDGNGEINIENLPIGKYYIKETKAPDGYVLPTLTANRKYYFEIGFNPDK